jgi:intein/homing endonuclease
METSSWVSGAIGVVGIGAGIVCCCTGVGAAVGVPLIVGGVGALGNGVQTEVQAGEMREQQEIQEEAAGRERAKTIAGTLRTLSNGATLINVERLKAKDDLSNAEKDANFRKDKGRSLRSKYVIAKEALEKARDSRKAHFSGRAEVNG